MTDTEPAAPDTRPLSAKDFADVIFSGEPWTYNALVRAIRERDGAALQEARDQVVRLTRERGALSDELDLAIWRAGHALEAAGLPKNAKDFLTGALDYLAPAAASPPPSSVHAPAPSLPTLEQGGGK